MLRFSYSHYDNTLSLNNTNFIKQSYYKTYQKNNNRIFFFETKPPDHW